MTKIQETMTDDYGRRRHAVAAADFAVAVAGGFVAIAAKAAAGAVVRLARRRRAAARRGRGKDEPCGRCRCCDANGRRLDGLIEKAMAIDALQPPAERAPADGEQKTQTTDRERVDSGAAAATATAVAVVAEPRPARPPRGMLAAQSDDQLGPLLDRGYFCNKLMDWPAGGEPEVFFKGFQDRFRDWVAYGPLAAANGWPDPPLPWAGPASSNVSDFFAASEPKEVHVPFGHDYTLPAQPALLPAGAWDPVMPASAAGPEGGAAIDFVPETHREPRTPGQPQQRRQPPPAATDGTGGDHTYTDRLKGVLEALMAHVGEANAELSEKHIIDLDGDPRFLVFGEIIIDSGARRVILVDMPWRVVIPEHVTHGDVGLAPKVDRFRRLFFEPLAEEIRRNGGELPWDGVVIERTQRKQLAFAAANGYAVTGAVAGERVQDDARAAALERGFLVVSRRRWRRDGDSGGGDGAGGDSGDSGDGGDGGAYVVEDPAGEGRGGGPSEADSVDSDAESIMIFEG